MTWPDDVLVCPVRGQSVYRSVCWVFSPLAIYPGDQYCIQDSSNLGFLHLVKPVRQTSIPDTWTNISVTSIRQHSGQEVRQPLRDRDRKDFKIFIQT